MKIDEEEIEDTKKKKKEKKKEKDTTFVAFGSRLNEATDQLSATLFD